MRRLAAVAALLLTMALVLTGCRAERPKPEMTVHLEQVGEGLQVRAEIKGFVIPQQGHMHIRIDDGEETMAYSATYTVPKLAPGMHKVYVELSDLQHRPLGVAQTLQFEMR